MALGWIITVEPLMSRCATPTSLVSITSPVITGIELASTAPSKYTDPVPYRTPAGPSAARAAEGMRKITIHQFRARIRISSDVSVSRFGFNRNRRGLRTQGGLRTGIHRVIWGEWRQ